MSRETSAKPYDVCMDVVVDLSQVPAQGRFLLLESLVAIDEGMACHYHVRCGSERLTSAEQGLLLELLSGKNAQICRELPVLAFPQEQVDQDITLASNEDAMRRAMAKQAWHLRNLSVLHAIEKHEEFVYLTPASVLLRHGWLAEVAAAGRAGNLPVYACPRRLRLANGYRQCGWSPTGWYNGRRLRALPLRASFLQRIANPWRERGDFLCQSDGPSFCLGGEWLSGFDVPMDFLLFALYFRQALNSKDPLVWAEAAEAADTCRIRLDEPESGLVGGEDEDDEAVLLQTYDTERSTQQARLRDLYKDAARVALHDGEWALKAADVALPNGAPRWSFLVANQVRFGLDELRDRFRDERCFIIGNGPSLKHTDLRRLQKEYTIGLNRIYLNYANMGFQPSFLCVTNPNIIEQFHAEIDALDSIKFLNYKAKDLMRNRWNTFFMDSKGVHDFYEDLSAYVWCEGCTVTYCAMQVAYYLGFEEVVLVGVDHGFPNSGVPHKLVTADGPDLNHFHPDYFGKGIKWQYPDLPASEVSYRVAKAVYEQDGRRILDATVNGNLRVFPRVDYLTYLNGGS
ncbi:6-hydroxymethylpterin diphosphokinase MptE-like protein [Thiocystis violacea]|uniref:6-hydroxymethylpterin diphosphokinase MptE-like protein n=1 Tax=Thiocystis violacea TaxID=13725 RepID=UPI001903C32F|nr:6-hydroxymethylpterin diphosphokinase MptE-like protein [Thiocystis violacea]MBK1720028.1 hypothetical protein [Thiocystis violacea]